MQFNEYIFYLKTLINKRNPNEGNVKNNIRAMKIMFNKLVFFNKYIVNI